MREGIVHLGPGDYSIFVGGANYGGVSTASFAFNATLSVAVIPEPSTYALFGFGTLMMMVASRCIIHQRLMPILIWAVQKAVKTSL